MHFSSLVVVFVAASAMVSGTPTKSSCTRYYCESANTQLACCSLNGVNNESLKEGCEAYVNNQASGTCDPSHINCCAALDTTTGIGAFCGPASAQQYQC